MRTLRNSVDDCQFIAWSFVLDGVIAAVSCCIAVYYFSALEMSHGLELVGNAAVAFMMAFGLSLLANLIGTIIGWPLTESRFFLVGPFLASLTLLWASQAESWIWLWVCTAFLAAFVCGWFRHYLTEPPTTERENKYMTWDAETNGLGENPFWSDATWDRKDLVAQTEIPSMTRNTSYFLDNSDYRHTDKRGRVTITGQVKGRLFAGSWRYALEQMAATGYEPATITELLCWLPHNRECLNRFVVCATGHEPLRTGFRGVFCEFPTIARDVRGRELLGSLAVNGEPMRHLRYLGVRRMQ